MGTITLVSNAAPSGNYDISTLGTQDWYGYDSSAVLTKKSGGPSSIAFSNVGGTSSLLGAVTASWTGGTPTATETGSSRGGYSYNTSSPLLTATVTVGTAVDDIYVLCGGGSNLRWSISISDGSASTVTGTQGSAGNVLLHIQAGANSAGQTLTIALDGVSNYAYIGDVWTIAGSGAATHTTTGALTGQNATVAGSATHLTLHTSTGALSAQSATAAGAATHLTLHTSSGALSAQSATASGSAAHQHAASGALAAGGASIAGSAAHLTLHTTAGALTAQAATVGGTAAHVHATTGALSASAATVAGSADHTAAGGSHSTSGALASAAATVAGTAAHLTLHTSTGALSADSASISGAASHLALHLTTGALAADAATVYGIAQLTSLTPIVIVDTHDGFNKKGGYDKYRKAKDKLRADINAAFPQDPPLEILAKVEAIAPPKNSASPQEIARAVQAIAEIQKAIESIIDEEETLMVLL